MSRKDKEKNSNPPPEISEAISETEIPEQEDTQPDTSAFDELEEKVKAAEDKYLRLMAEFDNYRKRTEKEKGESFSNATAKCICEFLPVVDNFERALKSECTDENYKKGVQLIYNQLCDILKKLGVVQIDALGKPFDPNFHNAIKQAEAEGFEENAVCEVMQNGYMLGDKVIRYALVVVAQ